MSRFLTQQFQCDTRKTRKHALYARISLHWRSVIVSCCLCIHGGPERSNQTLVSCREFDSEHPVNVDWKVLSEEGLEDHVFSMYLCKYLGKRDVLFFNIQTSSATALISLSLSLSLWLFTIRTSDICVCLKEKRSFPTLENSCTRTLVLNDTKVDWDEYPQVSSRCRMIFPFPGVNKWIFALDRSEICPKNSAWISRKSSPTHWEN